MNIQRHTYRLPGTVRKALFDCRNFLRELNRHSDECNENLGTMRVAAAQQHYEHAEELIKQINECLK